ncbi:hypothetical protein F4802DRAFT_356864 [Xylaria palmicola]|nr:hypothetical protein F4802DRAFT_356864 [Xylaria palmicola]
MEVLPPFQEYPLGEPLQHPRQPVDGSMTSSPLSPFFSDGRDSLQYPRKSWNGVPTTLSSPAASSHRYSFPNKAIPHLLSPESTQLLSPIVIKEKTAVQPDVTLYIRTARKGSCKRKSEDDDGSCGNESVSLPGCQTLLPYNEPRKRSYTASPLRTPSTTPEPSQEDTRSRRPSLFLAQDPITEKLNRFRIGRNKQPLPPLGNIYNPGHLVQRTPKWATVPQAPSEPRQQPSPPREIRKRRTKTLKTTHCNIKYLVEELDYIRYQRVDFGQKWSVVESSFCIMFPMAVFPRKTQGLQGVNYRQNKFLPRIYNGQLVFMENGHIEPVCIKTREQTERKHLYTLVYLYPDRAMNYSWVSLADRERARKINEERQKQLERAHSEAKERGTYVDKLPTDVPCGCCPGEDRERDKKKRPRNKLMHKKHRLGFRPRL